MTTSLVCRKPTQWAEVVGATLMNSLFVRTRSIKSDGGKSETHLVGPNGDSYALCGMDIAGDPNIHKKEPEYLTGINHRITCSQCNAIVNWVKDYMNLK